MVSKNNEAVQQQTEMLKRKITSYLRDKGINVNASFNCLNPQHDDHDHSMTYNPTHLSVYCKKCQAYYDIFDLVANDFHLNYSESRAKVAELYSIPLITVQPRSKVSPQLSPRGNSQQRSSLPPPLPLGDSLPQTTQVASYGTPATPFYNQNTTVADALSAADQPHSLRQEDINRRCSEIWGKEEAPQKPIEGPVLAPEDDFDNPYIVGNKAQGNKRMVLSNPTAPSTLINGCAFNDRELNKVKSDLSAASRREREDLSRRTKSLSALVADAQSQNARRDPFAPFNGNTTTIISTGSNKPTGDALEANTVSTILSDTRHDSVHTSLNDGKTPNHSSSNGFNFSFEDVKASPNTIASNESRNTKVDFTKIDEPSEPMSPTLDLKDILPNRVSPKSSPADPKKSVDITKATDTTSEDENFGIELVSADIAKKKKEENKQESDAALAAELAKQREQLECDLASLKTPISLKKAPHTPQFTLAEDDTSEDSESGSTLDVSITMKQPETPAEAQETPKKTIQEDAPVTPVTSSSTSAQAEKKTEITMTPVKNITPKPELTIENDPIIPVAAASAQIANEQAAEQAAERSSRLFITSTLDEAQSIANLGFAAIALNQPDQSSVLIEQLKIYHNQYTCFICLQPTEEWQQCAVQLEQELDEANQAWEELDLISPYSDITEALQSDRDVFISRLQELDSPLVQELISVVAPMKNSGFIGSLEMLTALRPAHLLYTMTANNVALSRLVISGLVSLKKEILFAGSKMQWQMICNRLNETTMALFENPNKDTSSNTRVVSQADRAASSLNLQDYPACLIELPLELDSRSILLALTQAIMDMRNGDPEMTSPVVMIDTFSFEDSLCAAIAPLLAELALGLSIPLMVWCSQKQRTFFEGQSVQVIEISSTTENSLQFKTVDQNCRPVTFSSLARSR